MSTYVANSKGASVTLTVNDITLRATGVSADTRSRQVRIALLDSQGAVVQQVVVPPNTVQTSPIDFPARLIEIIRPDLSIKAYICPAFVVFF